MAVPIIAVLVVGVGGVSSELELWLTWFKWARKKNVSLNNFVHVSVEQ